MKAMLYLTGKKDPVGVFDEVNIITMNDNHKAAPQRLTYKTQRLNVSKTMLELFRDEKMALKLEDGRTCTVFLQHNSLDMEGNAVGVLRVLDELSS